MKKAIFVFTVVLLSFVYQMVFSNEFISSGDWSYRYLEYDSGTNQTIAIWRSETNLGQSIISTLNIDVFYKLSIYLFTQNIEMPWFLYERVVWLIPFIIIAGWSSYYLSKYLVPQSIRSLTSVIYATNTYILMIVGGGQLAIAMAYAFAPFVVAAFISLVKTIRHDSFLPTSVKIWRVLVFSIAFSLQLMFDIRIAYVTSIAVFLYCFILIILYKKKKEVLLQLLSLGIIIGAIIVGIHTYWLLPMSAIGASAVDELGIAYTGREAVEFFSFSFFENSFSLLHPNWPENIFGKVGFQRAEFMLLPILAFSSLLFIQISNIKNQVSKKQIRNQKDKDNQTIQQSKNVAILFFVLLALLGAFLAKGANDPFGGIYLWMFEHVPGFIMFRDPTKWYVLIALSFAILIPYSLNAISEWLQERYEIRKLGDWEVKHFVFATFIIYWLFLIRPAWTGGLTGTFQPKQIPEEYIGLKDYIYDQDEYFRTFWVPEKHVFGYSSSTNPAINAASVLDVSGFEPVYERLSQENAEEQLSRWGVKYVIVPHDTNETIFLEDRAYSHDLYQETVQEIQEISWLQEVDEFGDVRVFETSFHNDRFWFQNENSIVENWQQINPTRYQVSVEVETVPTTLAFSEKHDPNWAMSVGGDELFSVPTEDQLNSFVISEKGEYTIEIVYEPQKYVRYGLIISGSTLLFLIVLLVFLYTKKKAKLI